MTTTASPVIVFIGSRLLLQKQKHRHDHEKHRKSSQSNLLAQSLNLDNNNDDNNKSNIDDSKIVQQQQDTEDDYSWFATHTDLTKTKRSKSGILYADVMGGLNKLYPPQELNQRNAASRTDGYWPYIQKGMDPPTETTYGEFNLYFFAQLLDKAMEYYDDFISTTFNNNDRTTKTNNSIADQVFCDIGSGAGRLVMAAAALHPSLKKCRGIELLPSIHAVAKRTLQKCHPQQRHHDEDKRRTTTSFVDESDVLQQLEGKFVLGQDTEVKRRKQDDPHDKGDHDDNTVPLKPETPVRQSYFLPSFSSSSLDSPPLCLAPMEFQCGSFENEYFGDATFIFCFSSCMSPSILSKLSKTIGRSCQSGTIVMTTEYPLELEGMIDPLMDNHDDDNDYTHCTYDGDFDHEDDAKEWIRFVQEERKKDPIMNQPRPFQFELLETMEGPNWVTGGTSTAFLHRLVLSAKQVNEKESSHDDNVPDDDDDKNGTLVDLEEQAAMAWIYAQKQNPQDFYRTVRNNMVFHGFDPSWYQGLVDGMD